MICRVLTAQQCGLICLGDGSRFKTDTDISGGSTVRERNLQKWESSADVPPDSSLNLSLESGSNTQPWDQFAANQRLFGLQSNYDEHFYTTKIDKSHPEYEKRVADAERREREIMGSAPMTAHVAEERGGNIQADGDDDEESK